MSVAGTTYEVRIEQKSDSEFVPATLTFPAGEPLTIEWEEKDKEDVLHGSTATLQIESPGDRTYIDLFSVEPGLIRLSVYKEGTLYWRGCLDPEFYEEPYERASMYDVSLTFSDFGILERLKYNLSGMQTLRAVITDALDRSGIEPTGIVNRVTSAVSGGTSASFLDDVSVSSANFCDEDGEWNNLQEVVEGVLQPFGIHMQQAEGGNVVLYDINAVAVGTDSEEVYWSGDEQTLGTDKVANNVQITFSPYVNDDVYSVELEYTDDYKAQRKAGTALKFYNAIDHGSSSEFRWLSHYVALSTNGKGLAYLNTAKARYCHIEPIVGNANEQTCVAWLCLSNEAKLSDIQIPGYISNLTGKKYPAEGLYQNFGQFGCMTAEQYAPLMRTERFYVAAADPAEEDTSTSLDDAAATMETPAAARLKITLGVCISSLYNPFESDDDTTNDQGNDDYVNDRGRVLFVPFTLVLYDADGNALYHYRNYQMKPPYSIGEAFSSAWDYGITFYKQEWVKGAPSASEPAFFAYYANDKRGTFAEKSGISGGFADNKYTALLQGYGVRGAGKGQTYPKTNKEDGEYIPFPPVEGYLELTVYSGAAVYSPYRWISAGSYLWPSAFGTSAGEQSYTEWLNSGKRGSIYNVSEGEGGFKNPRIKDGIMSDDTNLARSLGWLRDNGCGRLRHVYYKAPEIKAVFGDAVADDLDADDIVYSGYINKAAKDEISIDTICGTSEDDIPTARGLYRLTSDGSRLKQITRAGITDLPERLLIGTLYSQYAERHTTLTGEADIPAAALRSAVPYTEQNQEGRVFWLAGESRNLIADTSELTLKEVSADEYHAIEEVEE